MLDRALASVDAQTYEGHVLRSVALAEPGEGAWTVRNRAVEQAVRFAEGMGRPLDWIAFLDDDDELLPHHLSLLIGNAEREQQHLTWGWFRVNGGADPFPKHRGRQFDPDHPHVVPITYVARAPALLAALDQTGGFQSDESQVGDWMVQDAPLLQYIARRGSTRAYPDVTWVWHHHGGNTSGLPRKRIGAR